MPQLEKAATAAELRRGDELARVRRSIAELDTERKLMLVEVLDPSSFNQQVLRAQQSLQAKGEYGGNLDGIYGELTRQAMLSRGADISTEMKILKAEESALSPVATIGSDEVSVSDIGAALVTLTPAQKAKAGAAKLREQAKEMRALNIWGERALWVVEIARSFSVWAFLMTVTAGGGMRVKRTQAGADEPEQPPKPDPEIEAKPEPEDIQQKAEPEPEPVISEPPPEEDPDAPMSPSDRGKLGVVARKHYAEAIEAGKIEIPPPDAMTNRKAA